MRQYALLIGLLILLGLWHQALAQSCTGFCTQQVSCTGGATTSVTGTVFAPNGTDPVPNALVYVPNGGGAPNYGVQAFPFGVQTSAAISGSPLVQTISAANGTFTIDNMPVGTNIPLVMQVGKWRRLYTIPNVSECVNTALPTVQGATQTRLPTKEGEFSSVDSIPSIAIVTGAVDTPECTLRKIGVSDTEFSNPSGTGHISFYLGQVGAGAQISATTPSETTLVGAQATVDRYDAVMLPCQGTPDTLTQAEVNYLVGFANAGGHVIADDDEFAVLSNYSPFNTTAAWYGFSNEPVASVDPTTAFINTGFDGGMLLAQWLQTVGGSTTLGQMSLNTLRPEQSSLASRTRLWTTVNDPTDGTLIMKSTFNTPIGQPPDNQYGVVSFQNYHILDSENNPSTGVTFPGECVAGQFTPQEHVLEFDLFTQGWVPDLIFANGFE